MDRNRLYTIEILETAEVREGKVTHHFYNARVVSVKGVSDRVRRNFPHKKGQFGARLNTDLNYIFSELKSHLKRCLLREQMDNHFFEVAESLLGLEKDSQKKAGSDA